MSIVTRLWAQVTAWAGGKPPDLPTRTNNIRRISPEDRLIAQMERDTLEMQRTLDLIRQERDAIQGRQEGGPGRWK